MFSQRKRFYQKKSFYGIIAAFLLAFGVWFNTGLSEDAENGAKEPAVNVGEQVPSDGTEQNDKPRQDSDHNYSYGSFANDDINGTNGGAGDEDDEDGEDAENRPQNEDADGDGVFSSVTGENQSGPYYLLKEDGGYIKLYAVDETGKPQLLRTTDITFSLLSETDQKLFEQGVIKQTKDELSDLLEDFES